MSYFTIAGVQMHALHHSRMDNKIETVRIGNKVGVPSVPNVLAKVNSYAHLQEVSEELGTDLVIQSAFGDSGHTTFFVSNEDEYYKYAEEIEAEPEVKIMKRINSGARQSKPAVPAAGP